MLIFESSVPEVAKTLKAIVEDINANIDKLDTRGPVSKYVVPEEGIRGRSVMNLYILLCVDMLLVSHVPE